MFYFTYNNALTLNVRVYAVDTQNSENVTVCFSCIY